MKKDFEILSVTAVADGLEGVAMFEGGALFPFAVHRHDIRALAHRFSGYIYITPDELARHLPLEANQTAVDRDMRFEVIGKGRDPSMPHEEYDIGMIDGEPHYWYVGYRRNAQLVLTDGGDIYKLRELRHLDGSGVALNESIQVFKSAGIESTPTGKAAWDADAAKEYATQVKGGEVPLTHEQIVESIEALIHELDLRHVTTRLLCKLIPAAHDAIVSAARDARDWKGVPRWSLVPSIYDADTGEHVYGDDDVEQVEEWSTSDDFGICYALKAWQ